MDRFHELWLRATKTAEDGLAREGMPADRTRGVVHLLNQVNFPAALALLGKGSTKGKVGDDLLAAAAKEAAKQPGLASRGIDAAGAERMLKALWVHRSNPRDVLNDEAVLGLLTEVAAKELANSGVVVRPEEARKALNLLATGEFFHDAAGTTAAVLHVIPKLPIALVKDVPKTPFWILKLGQAAALDLGGIAFRAPAVVTDILDGTLDNPPALMTHTLRALYGMAGIRTVAEMIGTLLAPENESVRLALVLYARANGVPLEPEHLDAVRTSLLNTGSPDLGPLLVVGLAELRKRYGAEKWENILQAMAA
jgi:hypothetical protein